jgi:hypothetical protein
VKCYVWNIALYGVEIWTLQAVDQKHVKMFGNVVLEEDGKDQLD